MAINLDGANTYFKSHVKAKVWLEYSIPQRTNAIEQAKRDLSQELGRPMDENLSPYQYGDRRRDDFVVYEQAIYILKQNGIVEGEGSAVPPLDAGEVQPEVISNEKFAPAALRWLGQAMGVVMGRG